MAGKVLLRLVSPPSPWPAGRQGGGTKQLVAVTRAAQHRAMFLLAIAAAAALGVAPPETFPTVPPASIDESLEITGESLDAEQKRSRLFLGVKVNGQGPFRFVVDSGADRSVVGAALAAKLALPSEGGGVLRSMAGNSQVSLVRIDTLAIGQSIIDGITAPALPERFIGAQGVIGIDALVDQRIMLDFDAKTVTIQDSRKPAPRLDGEIVVTAQRRKGQLILTQASVDGSRTYAVIDTGSELTLGNRAMLLRTTHGRRVPEFQTISLVSVAGENFTAQLAIIPELRIGGVILQNVQVAFTDAPPFELFGLDQQPALLLGTDLLKSFKRLSLDFRNRKVRFTLRR